MYFKKRVQIHPRAEKPLPENTNYIQSLQQRIDLVAIWMH
jgi:hypothetical protein